VIRGTFGLFGGDAARRRLDHKMRKRCLVIRQLLAVVKSLELSTIRPLCCAGGYSKMRKRCLIVCQLLAVIQHGRSYVRRAGRRSKRLNVARRQYRNAAFFLGGTGAEEYDQTKRECNDEMAVHGRFLSG
jgi:hypothetical protein